MFLKDGDEAIAMRGLDEVNHLVNDDIFEQVLWFLHQLGVESNVTSPVVAASPFGFHPLQKVAANIDFELSLPLLDQHRHLLVEQCFVPLMNNLGTLGSIAS